MRLVMNDSSNSFLTDDQLTAVSVINIITSLLSTLGSGSIILSAIIHRRVCSAEVFPLFHLSVADLLASLLFLTNTALYLNNSSSIPGTDDPCNYIAAFFTSFYISTFLLTFSYALEAYLRLRRRLSSVTTTQPRHFVQSCGPSYPIIHALYLCSWTIPLVILVSLIIVIRQKFDNPNETIYDIIPADCSVCLPVFHYNENVCWDDIGELMHLIFKLVFMVPLLVVFIVNMIVYIFLIHVFRQIAMRRGVLNYHQRQEENAIKYQVIKYQAAFLVCWLPSLILGCISFTVTFHMQKYFWLYLLQAILGPLQGFLNCIIYGWKRESFRLALSERTSLISTNQPSHYSVTI